MLQVLAGREVYVVELPFFCEVFFFAALMLRGKHDCIIDASSSVCTAVTKAVKWHSYRATSRQSCSGALVMWVPRALKYVSIFIICGHCRRTADATKSSKYFMIALLLRRCSAKWSLACRLVMWCYFIATSARSCDLEDLIVRDALLIFIRISACSQISISNNNCKYIVIIV